MTLNRYLDRQQAEYGADPALADTVACVVEACKTIAGRVNQGALAGILGSAGSGNVQGEEQKKLDVLANAILINALKECDGVAGLASEEEEGFIACPGSGRYLVLFDPLDGSSNIDVNVSIGTIFSILEKPAGSLNTDSFLQAGKNQVAAGYMLYGPQTLLVLTLKHGAALFALNEDLEFSLIQEALEIPPQTAEFAINMSNQRHWDAPVQQYVAELLAGKTGARGKDFNMRWVASMVAEVHRILMRGGIFLYPKDARSPDKPGKLRLMYEANPLSLIVQQAGGAASDLVHADMLDIIPTSLHQRVAVVLGSREEVDYVRGLHG